MFPLGLTCIYLNPFKLLFSDYHNDAFIKVTSPVRLSCLLASCRVRAFDLQQTVSSVAALINIKAEKSFACGPVKHLCAALLTSGRCGGRGFMPIASRDLRAPGKLQAAPTATVDPKCRMASGGRRRSSSAALSARICLLKALFGIDCNFCSSSHGEWEMEVQSN